MCAIRDILLPRAHPDGVEGAGAGSTAVIVLDKWADWSDVFLLAASIFWWSILYKPAI